MSGFKALNVDSESEEEIDDTKEIQLEEAFKLYQNALKLHSQGPNYYDEASDAYGELFKSEVFKYPEAISEFAHDQEDDPSHPIVQPDAESVPVLPANAADSSANSIPLLVYLSYKNKGQLAIDKARNQLASDSPSRQDLMQHFAAACGSGIQNFAEALERDDTDIDLWKKAARVAEVLSNQRISRFCMESVLAGDDDGTEQTIDLSGLDEAFAAGELAQILKLLEDDVSQAHSSDVHPKEPLLKLLSKSNDPYPFLPNRPRQLEYLDERRRPDSFHVNGISLRSNTISNLGQEILQAIISHQGGKANISAHTIVSANGVELPQSPARIDTEVFMDAEEDIQPTMNDLAPSSITLETRESPEKMPVQDGRLDSTDPSPRQDGTGMVEDLPPDPASGSAVDLPTRKRSATTAGHEEPEGRVKSKRLRARESMVEAPVAEEETVVHEVVHKEPWDWIVLQNADKDQLKVLDTFLSRLNVPAFGSVEDIKADCTTSSNLDVSGPDPLPSRRLLSSDLSRSIRGWTDEHSQAILFGHGNQEFVEKSTGLTLFLQHSKGATEVEIDAPTVSAGDELSAFFQSLAASQTTLYDAAFTWLLTILSPDEQKKDHVSSSYMRETWPDDLKQTVVQLLLRSEEYLLDTLRQRYREMVIGTNNDSDESGSESHRAWRKKLMELVQTIFELHIDIYSRITNPSSQVEKEVRIKQADSLERWAGLADDFMRVYTGKDDDSSVADSLVIRFLWASTIYGGKAEDVDQNHTVLCLEDLKRILQELEVKPIVLPNNAAMPQISVPAVEQEIQRLSTLDFFLSVFDNDNSDPVAVIEKLEPILELDNARQDESGDHPTLLTDQAQQAVLDFLDSGDASLKLFLWRRLQNAYITIPYIPKVVSCLLRAIETIFRELCSTRHAQMEDHHRQVAMLKWVRDLDEILIRTLSKILNEPNPLECLDDDHLRSSITAISFLLRIMHVFALYEDNIRFQYAAAPQFKGAMSTKNFEKSKDRLREIQVRLWTLQYFLLKEATTQHKNIFPDRANDLADYLCTVHFALGQRLYCKHSNKQFVKLVKSELNTLETTNDYTADVAQVLYDLYQMKFVVGQGDFDHGCTTETLDKKTALSLIPIVMFYARRMNIKDLIKSDLRLTIEKVQAASGKNVSPPPAMHNRKIINAFLKSPIIPEDLFKAVKGLGGLSTKPVLGEGSVKSTHGWFFLLGHITLAKYRSVKRVSPTPTDDLDVASTLLKQDLEFDIEKWETWFRLAQIYEAKIEDDLIWNSTKLNEARGEIAQLERHSIHAFSMALAQAMRSADDDAETRLKIAELHQEFAMRLYASSREPLNMEAFNTDKSMRHISSNYDGTMSKVPFHQPISKYTLWHFAAYLLRRKVSEKPKSWTSHYTLGKCLWKMFESPENQDRRNVRPEEVLEAFVDAVEASPKKEKSTDYILEPHFKLVSIVHKMVHHKHIKAQIGRDWLQATRFAQGVVLAIDEDGDPDWERYILEILKRLSTADKQHWHHRIIARAAHVIYDGQANVAGALGAKHEFTQQIFTKTMTYQVWKPEFERPGRHYVYTGRYVLFFAQLLDKLNDRPNLDQLVRRVRRKQTDFIDHEKVWGTIATTYVNLLRRSAKIPDGRERAVFDPISYEEFSRNSEKLEKWALDEDTSSIVLDVMRDAIELKKINNSLLKGGAIDDLIGDAYACMYEAFVAQLPPEEQQNRPPSVPQGTFLNMTANGLPSHDGSSDLMQATPAQAATANAIPGPSDSADLKPPVQPIVGLGLQTPTHQFIGTPSSLPNALADPSKPPVEKPKPGRAKTITRREIQRKAEAVLVKPPPIKTPTLMKRPVVQIVVPNAGDSPAPGRVDDLREDRDGNGEGQESMLSSRRGSVQSSAAGGREGSVDAGEEGDDESELSDIEENEQEGDEDADGDTIVVQKKSMFPKLPSQQQGGGHESDADEDDEDEDGEEGDEFEDEEHDHRPGRNGDRMDVDEEDEEQGDEEPEIQDSQEVKEKKQARSSPAKVTEEK